MRPDRKWMYNRLTTDRREYTPEFLVGLENFVEFACGQPRFMDGDKIKCPCVKCHNRAFEPVDEVKVHLLRNGFVSDYYTWTRHGEPFVQSTSRATENVPNVQAPDNEQSNSYRRMVIQGAPPTFNPYGGNGDEEEPPNSTTQKLYDMLSAADTPLYKGCDEHTQLSTVSRLLTIKSENHLSEKGYDDILKFLKEALPKTDNKLVEDFYSTKKFVAGLGLPCEKIHCCINGCMLYWGEDVDRTNCKVCNRPRYKSQRYGGCSREGQVPFKKMYYFPLTPRLQRLYASDATAKHMRWHDEHRQETDVMCHPSDAEAWKHFNHTHPTFASEPRNVRLGLCTDGFQPFGQSGKQYSLWPVIMTPYNLPPWMCMKDQYMFLTVIVPGPNNPKAKLDVYLQPLIAELKNLWLEGVPTYDVSRKQNFQMRAALMWTISDFPAYAMLSGWSTAGKKACPYCMEDSKAFSLPNGGKVSWFDCHRQFLPANHPYRRNKNDFLKNRIENSPPPPLLSGEDILAQLDALGLKQVMEIGSNEWNAPICKTYGWNKRSIFWDLPYWSTNLIRHNLDVMHIEKNVFENIFATVMDIEGKTKDNAKAREDLKQFCRRRELERNEVTGKYPKACYSLDKAGKKAVCEWVNNLQFPDGYASNLSRCVDMKKYKLFGMKSHDCHVFMQRLLPIAFREFLPTNVWKALMELSLFFKNLTCTTLNVEDMKILEEKIPAILCKLERIFPPSFFDSMEHLPIHLPYEARVAGPVQYRWMYPYERYLRKLKMKVTNKARVEGSICNAYLVEEASNFSSYYFAPHVETRLRKVPRNDDGGHPESFEGNLSIFTHPGRAFGRGKARLLTEEEYHAAQAYVLLNCTEVEHYVKVFIEEVKSSALGITTEQIDYELETQFAAWFDKYAQNPINNVDNPFIRALAMGPLRTAISYQVYFVNGFKFHTISRGNRMSTMNSGVCIKGSNYSDQSSDYYGQLIEVLQLEYPELPIKRTVLFKCEWYDPTPDIGMKVHTDYNLVEINKRRRFNKYEPFILAMQAAQVYYAPYPSLRRDKSDWLAVCKIKPRSVVEASTINNEEENAFQEDEFEEPPIINVDDAVGSLNDPSGGVMDIMDGDDEVEFEDEVELQDVDECELQDGEDDEEEYEDEEEDDSD